MKKILLVVLVFSSFFINSCGSESKDEHEGGASLLNLSAEPEGENCENGGTRVDSGLDLNSNGDLDDDEILATKYICDGSDGEDGTNGTDGEDGTNGTDGEDGAAGTDGEDGSNGTDGEDGTNGTDGEDGTNGTDGEDGTNGTDGEDGNDSACYGNSAPVVDSIMVNDIEYVNSPVEIVSSGAITLIVNTTDTDGDTLQYSILGSHSSVENIGDDTFSMTVDEIGIQNFTVIVSDGCQIVMQNFSILINLGPFYDISLYGGGSCVINDGKAYCWGRNFDRELGAGINDNYKTVPVAVDDSGVLSGKEIISVSAGSNHACVLDTDGDISCWGTSYMGDGSGWSSNTSPVAVDISGVLNGKTVKKLATGYNNTCALDDNGELFCWGYNNFGQLGDGTQDTQLTPVSSLVGIMFKDVSLGNYHSCGIKTDGKLYCWGSNVYGQLGDGNGGCISWDHMMPEICIEPTFSTSAVEVMSDKKFASVSSGYRSSCALSVYGKVYCWGLNKNGRLGDGTTEDRLTPVKVEGLLTGKIVVAIATGSSHVCAVDSENKIYCWGYNDAGQLGDASYNESSTPVEVDMSGVLNGVSVKEISAGGYNTCVLSDANEVYCWGSGDVGRLGNNSTANSNVPVKVDPLP